MTDLTAVETLADLFADTATFYGDAPKVLAERVLASDWLAEQIAAAEKRGAVNALREAADDLDALQTPENENPAFRDPALWLHDRADRIEKGVCYHDAKRIWIDAEGPDAPPGDGYWKHAAAESDALVPCFCGATLTRPYPNDTGEHSTTECPIDRLRGAQEGHDDSAR